eukprot:755743-Hanusia_phi.AAC.1
MFDWVQQAPGATPAPGGDDGIDINTSKVRKGVRGVTASQHDGDSALMIVCAQVTAGFTSLVLVSTILGNLAQVPNLHERGTLAVMGSLDVDTQLYSIVFGESVINDAVAVVLFQT